MNKLLIALIILLSVATASVAEIRYISDVLVVTVRAEPNNKAKVLTTVQTGSPLEILETVPGFLKVQTSKGIAGYVRSQYVSTEIPKTQRIRQLEAEKAQLQQQATELTQKLSASKNQTQNLSSTELELAKIKEEYESLRTTSASALQISHERDQLQQENSDLAGRMQQLKEENNIYLRTGVIKWFLAGASVLFLGWIMGKISRKKKRNYL